MKLLKWLLCKIGQHKIGKDEDLVGVCFCWHCRKIFLKGI